MFKRFVKYLMRLAKIREEEPRGHSYVFTTCVKSKNEYNIPVKIVIRPTGNCQMISWINFREILATVEKEEIIPIMTKVIVASGYFEANTHLIDVYKHYEKIVDSIALKIFVKVPYTNPTGSEMILYLIKLKR